MEMTGESAGATVTSVNIRKVALGTGRGVLLHSPTSEDVNMSVS